MNENIDYYSIFKAKDSRFDGQFFVGVSSTKIYCRPICKAKLPLEKNCTFYHNAAQAERAGYRPCLLCRPELAPQNIYMDNNSEVAIRAAKLIEEYSANKNVIAFVASKLNYTPRHLHRIFTNHFDVSPIQYLQTYRLLLAKNLLTDTNLSITNIAHASGFNSIRSFNHAFKNHYRLSASNLRKEIKNNVQINDYISIKLSYHPPFLWEDILEFLSHRTIDQVEKVADNKYYRTLSIELENNEIIRGWISVENIEASNQLQVNIDTRLLLGLPQIIARVKQVFDLSCQPDVVYDKLVILNEIKDGLVKKGTRIPGSFEPFEMIVRAILGQQISVKAARTLAFRIVENYGHKIDTPIKGLNYTFLSYQDVIKMADEIENNFGVLGIIKRRSQTILACAMAFDSNEINFIHPNDYEQEIKKLQKIPGIGIWTAHYIALRTMSYSDAFLHTDLGIIKALAPLKPNEILELSNKWRPWRGYAMINLWNSLNTKEEK